MKIEAGDFGTAGSLLFQLFYGISVCIVSLMGSVRNAVLVL